MPLEYVRGGINDNAATRIRAAYVRVYVSWNGHEIGNRDLRVATNATIILPTALVSLRNLKWSKRLKRS
jgi:hypothetical protein